MDLINVFGDKEQSELMQFHLKLVSLMEERSVRFAYGKTKNIVKHRATDRQRLCKHILEGANERKNRTSIARQRISKHA
jgi:hypothetical protein